MIVISLHEPIHKNGFSLIEVVIVVSIMTLMMTLGIQIFFQTQTKLSFEHEVKKVRSILAQARYQSLTLKETITVKIDLEKNLVSIENSNKRNAKTQKIHQLPAGIGFEALKDDEISANQSIELFFFKDGQSSGGEIKITGHGFSKLIQIDWLGGGVEISNLRDAA